MMLPWQVTIVPQFLLFRYLNWLNTFMPLIVPSFFGGGAFYIFLLRQFFMTIPTEMDDAARIDGCSELRIFFRVILPSVKPAMATLLIIKFMWNWNEFFWPFLIAKDEASYTLPVVMLLVRVRASSVKRS